MRLYTQSSSKSFDYLPLPLRGRLWNEANWPTDKNNNIVEYTLNGRASAVIQRSRVLNEALAEALPDVCSSGCHGVQYNNDSITDLLAPLLSQLTRLLTPGLTSSHPATSCMDLQCIYTWRQLFELTIWGESDTLCFRIPDQCSVTAGLCRQCLRVKNTDSKIFHTVLLGEFLDMINSMCVDSAIEIATTYHFGSI